MRCAPCIRARNRNGKIYSQCVSFAKVTLMRKASLLDRVQARAPAYWPLMKEQPLWAVMFAFSRINAARGLERLISSAGHKKPVHVADTVFKDLDLDLAVAALIKDGVYQGLHLPA